MNEEQARLAVLRAILPSDWDDVADERVERRWHRRVSALATELGRRRQRRKALSP